MKKRGNNDRAERIQEWREADRQEYQESNALRLQIFAEICLRPEIYGQNAYDMMKDLHERNLSELRDSLKGIRELKEALREHILAMACESQGLTEEECTEVKTFLAEKTLAELEAIEVVELRNYLFGRICAVNNLNRNEQDATMALFESLSREQLIAFEKEYFKDDTTATAEVPSEKPAEEAPSGETDGESGGQQVKKADLYEERITHMIQERVSEQPSFGQVVWEEVDPDTQTEDMHEVKVDSEEQLINS